jgi:hypothetical protein
MSCNIYAQQFHSEFVLIICQTKGQNIYTGLGLGQGQHSILTNLFLKANMTAPACSAAFPTIGSKIMLRKLTDKPHDSAAS